MFVYTHLSTYVTTICAQLYYYVYYRWRNGLASEGVPKGHGAELMNNIAIASMHVILYIDILGPNFVMSGGGAWPP